jgi:hypothetical protein
LDARTKQLLSNSPENNPFETDLERLLNMKQTFLLTICFIFLMNSPLPAQIRPDRNPAGIGIRRPPTRKLNRAEMPPELKEKLKITEAEKIQFKEILKNSKAKIAKIWNSPCKYEKVVEVRDTNCWKQFDFSVGSHFAFSESNYAFPDEDSFVSVSLIEGEFWAGSYGPIHSLLADLGEVAISQISKETKEVKLLGSFPLIYNAADRKIEKISGTYEFQGLKISDKQSAKLNHAYLLRSVMYISSRIFTQNGEFVRPQKRETVHAFQVIKDQENVVTILWKKIESKRESVKLN